MEKRLRDGWATSSRVLAAASCCFGALIAALVVAIHRTGAMVLAAGLAAWKPFAGACLAGLLVVGGGLVLFYAREEFDRSSRCRRRRQVIGGVGVLVAVVGWLVPLPTLAGGVAEGLGVSLLLLAWLDWFARRTMAALLLRRFGVRDDGCGECPAVLRADVACVGRGSCPRCLDMGRIAAARFRGSRRRHCAA